MQVEQYDFQKFELDKLTVEQYRLFKSLMDGKRRCEIIAEMKINVAKYKRLKECGLIRMGRLFKNEKVIPSLEDVMLNYIYTVYRRYNGRRNLTAHQLRVSQTFLKRRLEQAKLKGYNLNFNKIKKE